LNVKNTALKKQGERRNGRNVDVLTIYFYPNKNYAIARAAMAEEIKIYDLIIIGGGPAGITAGIYAARAGLKTLLITKNFGGQINLKAVEIENYPGFEKISGLEFIQKLEHHLKKFAIEIIYNIVEKVKKENDIFIIFTEDKKQFQSKTLIIASGAEPRSLGVKGEKEFIGKGVSYCVTCDGPLFKDKTVAIIGGGNAGFEAALALAKWAKKIYILETLKTIQADKVNINQFEKLGAKGEIITNVEIKEIKGSNFVDSLVYQKRDTEEIKTLFVEGIFIEIGSIPATQFVKDLVEFNEKNEIKVNPKSGETSIAGLFAAGDVDDMPYKQIVIAAGEGAKAALSAAKYLKTLNPKS